MHTQFKNGGRGISFFMADHVLHAPVQCLTHFKLKNPVLTMLTCSIIYFYTYCLIFLRNSLLCTQVTYLPGSLHKFLAFCNNLCLFSSNSMKCCYFKRKILKICMLLLNQRALLLINITTLYHIYYCILIIVISKSSKNHISNYD